jgi:hypothetical protein
MFPSNNATMTEMHCTSSLSITEKIFQGNLVSSVFEVILHVFHEYQHLKFLPRLNFYCQKFMLKNRT